MEVVFVGTGEATDPELPNTSILLLAGAALLVDCGYSVPHALWQHSRDPNLLDGIYLTHGHADHFLGLPALLMWMRHAGRARPLCLLGAPGFRQWAEGAMTLGYPGAFAAEKCYPIEFLELGPDRTQQFGPLQLRSAESEHSVRNCALRVDAGGVAVAVSGDGAPTPHCESLYEGVDLLVHEAFRFDVRTKGHATAAEVVALSDRARVKELALVHLAAEERAGFEGRLATLGGACRRFVPSPGDRWTCSP